MKIKGADPADERYVFGVVLEPETVDSQGDIYSEEEIRKRREALGLSPPAFEKKPK